MKPLENLFYKEQMEINTYRDKLYTVLDLLVRYNRDPDNTVSEVLKQLKTDDREYDVFYDVSRGLNGEFTRDRAIVLGRRNIVYYIENTINELKEEITELSSASEKLLAILETNISSVIETNDSSQSVMDVTKALSEGVRKEYLAFKMTSVLDPKIQTELTNQQTPESFMYNYLQVILKTIDDAHGDESIKNALAKWKNIQTDFNTVLYVIKGVVDKNEALVGMDEYIPKEIDIKPSEYNTEEPYLLPTISKETGTSEEDKLEVFKKIVEEVNKRIPELTTVLKDTSKKIKTVTNKSKLYLVLDDINKNVGLYNKGEYTLDVLRSVLEADTIALTNYIYINNQVFNEFMTKLIKINSDVNLLDQASSLNKEILQKGTV